MIIPSGAAIAERRVVRRLSRKGATSQATAIEVVPRQFARRRALARLIDLDVVKTSGDRFYLNEAKWAERRSKQKKRALGLVFVGAAAAGIAAFIGRS